MSTFVYFHPKRKINLNLFANGFDQKDLFDNNCFEIKYKYMFEIKLTIVIYI